MPTRLLELNMDEERSDFLKLYRSENHIADYIQDEALMATTLISLLFDGWLMVRRADAFRAKETSMEHVYSHSVLTPCAYRVPASIGDGDVRIEEVPQRNGPNRWTGRWNGLCISKEGEWAFEPSGSSRDDAFYAACRFASPGDVLAVLTATKVVEPN